MQIRNRRPHNRGSTDKLHKSISYALLGFVGGWAVITFAFFLGAAGPDRNYGSITPLIVAAFAAVVLLLVTRLRHVAMHHPLGRDLTPSHRALSDWLQSDFEIPGDHIKGYEAAVMILSPGAAAMVGGTAFAIIFYLVAP